MGERNGDQKTAGGEISLVTCKCLLSCITPGVVFSSFSMRAKVSATREWNARHYCYYITIIISNIFFLGLPRPCLAYLALLALFALAFACLKKAKKKKSYTG